MDGFRALAIALLTIGLAIIPLPVRAQTGTFIEGRIIDSETGLPLADWVAVEAYDEAGVLVATQQVPTDANGRYWIPVTGGTYRLQFQDARLMGYGSEWWEDKPDFESADPIVVTEGVAGPFDFYVTGPSTAGGWITGSVIDSESGDPLPLINWVAYDLNGNVAVAGDRTDGSGVYRTTSLGTGSFKLAFEDTAYFDYQMAWYGGSDFASAAVIEVEEGVEVAGISVGMTLRSGSVAPLLPFGGSRLDEVFALALLLLAGGVCLLGAAKRSDPARSWSQHLEHGGVSSG